MAFNKDPIVIDNLDDFRPQKMGKPAQERTPANAGSENKPRQTETVGLAPAAGATGTRTAAPRAPIANVSDQDRNDIINTVIAEAAGEGPDGMAAVAHVIKNRSAIRGQSAGDVVRAPHQFTGYSQPGAMAVKHQNDPAFRARAEQIVQQVFDGKIPDPTGGADHYHATSVNPDWASAMPKTTQIGAHIFYNSKPDRAPQQRQAEGRVPNAPNPDGLGLAALVRPGERSEEQSEKIRATTLDSVPDLQPSAFNDLTAVGQVWNFGKMKANSLVFHHTAGRGDVRDVLQTFKQRGYPAHFVIDREGMVHQVLGVDQRGQHTRNSQINDVTNRNSWGVEIIANDDRDVTPRQVQSALQLTKHLNAKFGLPLDRVFGHGEINNHKQRTEGATVVNAIRNGGGNTGGRRRTGADLEITDPIVIEADFSPSDPMGLYAGNEVHPFEARRRALEEEGALADAEAAEVAAQAENDAHAEQIRARFEQLSAQDPERYQVIPESEFAAWREQWHSDQPSQLSKGFMGALIDQNPGLAANTLDALGVLLGSDTLREAGENLKTYGEKGAWKRQGNVGSFSEIRTDSMGVFLDDLGDYLGYALGSGMGSFVVPVATGAAGAVVGTAVAGPLGTIVGGAGGAFGASYVLGVGEVYGTLLEDEGVQARIASGELTEESVAKIAASAGLAVAGLDLVGLERVAGVATKPVQDSVVRAIARGVARGAISEGATEATQEAINQGVTAAVGGNADVANRVVSVVDSAIGGALAGGTMGGVAGGVRRDTGTEAEDADAPPAPRATPQPVTAAPTDTAAPAAPTAESKPEAERPAGSLARALEHGERRANEQMGGTFIVNDPAVDGSGPGHGHGAEVRISPNQDGVPQNMRRVIMPDGSEHVMGDRLLRPVQRSIPVPEAVAPDGAPAVGTEVTVNVPGSDPIAGRIESYEGGEPVVFDTTSGEVYQVPLDAISAPAAAADAPVEPSIVEREAQASAIPDGQPETPSAEELPGTEPIPAENRVFDAPEAKDTGTIAEVPYKTPRPGQRVIVAAKDIDRFSGTVVSYEEGATEAVIRRDDGTEVQVPVSDLRVSKLTQKETDQRDLAENPPVERETITNTDPTAREVFDKQIVLPDEKHAQLYDLGKNRHEGRALAGAGRLQMDDVMPAEQRRLAKEFGVSPQRLGQIADDYRYRVQRIARKANSRTPTRVNPVNEKLIGRMQAEDRREANEVEPAPAATAPTLQLDQAANEAATSPTNNLPEPTQAQKEAGNYKVGRVALGGLDISIENPKGSKRSGVDRDGKAWSVEMKHHYGYIRRTEGPDGDHVDTFIRPGTDQITDTDPVFVIDQVEPSTGQFDEHKVMLGYKNESQAKRAYQANYAKGWKGLGTLTQTDVAGLKAWIAGGETKKPFAPAGEAAPKAKPLAGNTAEWWDTMTPPQRDDIAFGQKLPTETARKRWADLDPAEQNALLAHRAAEPAPSTPAAPKTAQPAKDAKVSLERNYPEVYEHFAPDRAALGNFKKGDPVEYTHKDFYREPVDGSRDRVFTGTVVKVSNKEQGTIEVRGDSGSQTFVQARKLRHRQQPENPPLDGTETAGSSPKAQAEKPQKPDQTADKREPIEKKTGPKVAEKIDELFASNKLFTADKVEAARARLRSKMNQLNSGIDPEMLIDGMTIAGAYIEAGVRSFSDYAGRMVGDFGPSVRPYLLSFWEGARNYPGLDTKDMTAPDESARLFAELNRDDAPADVAPALGSEVKKPRKRTVKRGTPGDRTLVQDWGVEHIDAHSDEGEAAKANYLKDAMGYLRAVADIMQDGGWTPHENKRGRAEKPVSKNEAGPAVSGDVSLTLRNPDSGQNLYVHITGGSLRGVVPTTPSGINVMYRIGNAENDRYATRAGNRWAPVDLSANDFATILKKDAAGALSREDFARAAKEASADEPAKLDSDGPRPLEGTPSAPVPGTGESRPAGSGASDSSRSDVSRGESARSGRDDAAGGLGTDAEQLSPAAGGGRDGRGEPGLSGRRKDSSRNAAPEKSERPGRGRDRDRDTERASVENTPQPAGGLPASARPNEYTLSDADELGAGGAKTKFRNNVAAIQLLRQLGDENRAATRKEQAVLAKWVGWGGLRTAFYREDGSVAKGWDREAAELKELLTAEEYRAAESSTRNAHYTAPEIVRGMWRAIEHLGFKGGNVLEPSVGAGNFLGFTPGDVRGSTRFTGVELDHITGGIARNLYPQANIQAPVGYQDFAVPDGHFDLAIGNPPFGSERLFDAVRRNLNKFSIHNYFFAKSVDALKPNGVLAMVITNRFLDAANTQAREYIAAKADLLGAIRLPNNAFLANAGTEVTTDIVFLRKRRDGEEASSTAWVDLGKFTDKEGRSVPLNRYFIENPEMMLGDFGAYGTMYGPDEPALIAREGSNLSEQLARAIAALPQGIMDPPGVTIEPENITVPKNAADVLEGSMFLAPDGAIWERLPDSLGETQARQVEFPSDKAKQRVAGMIRVRDGFAKLRRAQLDADASESKLSNLRERLNKFYDAFVKSNGPINLDANKRLFRDDPTWPQISALEENFDRGVSPTVAKRTGEQPRKPSAQKAPIFTKRTQQPYSRPTTASSAKDALAQSLSEFGRIDLAHMEELYGKGREEIVRELGALVYQTPAGSWEPADLYLAGNVKQKLAAAEAAAEKDPAFRRNVDALRDVQPIDIEPVDIEAKPGAGWVPANHVSNFIDKMTAATGATAHYSSANAKWITLPAKPSEAAAMEWGTERVPIGRIIDATLNDERITVYDRMSDGSSVVNQAATDAANEKVERMKASWRRWIWEDDIRREELARIYNDTFNTDIETRYDGSHLTFPGKVGDDIIELRPHQKNFAWRVLQGKPVLADHTVGAGKTFSAIAAIMELRRTGQAKKPMLVVPNHLVGQWGADFIKLYPGARVLAATKKDFSKDNRRRLFARITTGDWDAVIVAHSSFKKIPVSPEYEAKFIDAQVADVEESIAASRAAAGERSRNVSQLTKMRDNLKAKLQRLMEGGGKDAGLTWDELGIDALFVDEAHEFKNLGFSTSMQRVAGLGNPAGSQKASDLYMKINQVLERTGGRNIGFLTGTPLSNTMAEMFTLQRYLDGPALKALGLSHFDAWARVFGEVVRDWELSPSGQYKMNERFARFVNMPELIQRYRSFADVITNEDIKKQLAAIGKKLPLPRVKGGKPNNIVVERSEDQADYIGVGKESPDGNVEYPHGSLVWRTEHLPKKAEKGADNMLKIMSDARKAALDMRLINPSLYGDTPGSKVHIAADQMKRIYTAWTDQKGTQLVFIDLSTPKNAKGREAQRIRDLIKKAEAGDEAAQEALDAMSPDELDALDGAFSVYDDLRQKLIDRGVPTDEIAFIHDANTELQKEELFGKVRSGRIRFLFGSTAKMGAGTNVQNRLVGLHHLDAPWRPSDLEQRDGRGIRQGNELYNADPDNFEIEILRYATKNTLDARQWQTIEAKARFIEQLRRGDIKVRVIEDIAGEAANAAEMKAAASGNPLILEEMDLRQKLRKLEGAASEHDREQHRIRRRIGFLREEAESIDSEMPTFEADAQRATATDRGDFSATIDGVPIEKPKDFGAAIISIGRHMLLKVEFRGEAPPQDIGTYGEFGLRLEHTGATSFDLILRGEADYDVHIADITDKDPVGMGMQTINTVRRLRDVPDVKKERAAEIKEQLPLLERQIGDFADAKALEETRARHTEVIDQLRPKPKKPQQPGAETEAGKVDDKRYSMFGAVEGAHTPVSLRKELEAGSAGAFIKRLEANGRLRIGTARELAGETPLGATAFASRGGHITLIADRIQPGTGTAILLHEAFHTGRKGLEKTKVWKALEKRLGNLYRQFERSSGRARQFFDAAREHVAQVEREYRPYSPDMAIEEFGAYALQYYEQAPRTLRRWVDDAAGAIKAWVLRQYGKQLGEVTPAELRALAVAALRDRAAESPPGLAQTDPSNSIFIPTGDYDPDPRKTVFENARDFVVERGKDTGVEHMLIMKPNGDVWFEGYGSRSAITFTPQIVNTFNDPSQNWVAHHNHPSSRSFSMADIEVMTYAGVERVFAHGHDGSSYNGRVSARLAPYSKAFSYDLMGELVRSVHLPAFQKLHSRTVDLMLAQRILPEEAEANLGHILNHALAEGGLIDYVHNKDASIVSDARWAGVIREIIVDTRTAIKEFENANAEALRAARRRAGPNFQHGGGLDGLSEEHRGDGRFREQGLGAGPRRRNDRAEAKAGEENRSLTPARRYSIRLDRNEVTDQLKGRWTDLSPKLLAAVPLNYFTELARPGMTAVGEYLKQKRAMDTYRGNKHADMDQVAQVWQRFAAKNRKAANDLSRLMHDSTLAQVDPAAVYGDLEPPAGYDALRARYEALPDAGQRLYRQVRNAYKKQQAELDQIIIENITKANEISVRKAKQRYSEDREKILRDPKLNGADRREALERLSSRFNADLTKSMWAQKARMTRLRKSFEANRVPEPYFPLTRFGRYFVTVRDMAGDVVSFSRFEREADRRRWFRANRAKIEGDFPGVTFEQGVIDNSADLKQAMDPRMVVEIEGILTNSGVDADVMDAIWQRYLQSMPDFSIRKRYIHRKGTAGYSQDALRSFASHMFHSAHQLARLKFGGDLAELVNETADQARRSDDPTAGGTLANELRLRNQWVMNPTGSKAVQSITSAMFVWYLGVTPAAALVNLTQTPMLGVPILGARLGGATRAAAALTKAASDTVAGLGSIQGAKLSSDEQKAVEAFYESGLIDRTQSHELAGVGETGVEYSPMRHRVMNVISWGFHRAEVWNREVTALAAYRMARAQKQSHEAAVDTAHDLTWKVHFDYSNSSRARLLQSEPAKLIGVFQNFQLNMWYRIVRDIHQALKGDTPNARREARFQLAGVMGMMSLMGGITGLFGYNVLMAVAGMFFGDDEDPFEFKHQMERHVVELFGPELGGMILKGIPGHLTGIELTNRIGMPDFFVRAPDQGLEGRDWWREMIIGALGVVPSTIMNVGDGMNLIGQGNVARGVELIAPKFVKDTMKAYRYANEGLATRRGDEILPADQISPWSLIAQAAGFTPAEISETYERRSRLYAASNKVQDERRELMNRFALAVQMNDEGARKASVEAIKKWNRKPYARGFEITRDTLRRSLKTRARNAARRNEGVLISNESLNRTLRRGMPERLYE